MKQQQHSSLVLPSRSKLRCSSHCLSAHRNDTLQEKRKQALLLQASQGTLEGPGDWNESTFLSTFVSSGHFQVIVNKGLNLSMSSGRKPSTVDP